MLADAPRPTGARRAATPAARSRCSSSAAAPVSGAARAARDRLLVRGDMRTERRGADARRPSAGHDAVPVQQGDQRVRRPQPARLRRDQRPSRTVGSDLGFEDLIAIAEASGSAPIYPLLKRVDERHVTMQAYDSPTFVEDVVAQRGARSRRRLSGSSASPSRPRTTRASTTTRRSPPSAGSARERPRSG